MEELIIPTEKKVVLEDTENNIKVVAGPGSGKTTLIIEKVKQLIDNGVKPNKILVITYTNKAAADLERKILRRLPNERGFYISTIHGFCTRFIRDNAVFFQDYRDFKVLDELEQFLFIVKYINLIRTDDLPYMKRLVFDLKNYFGRIKDNYPDHEINKKEHSLKQSYQNYCNQLKFEKKLDFGDLINVVINTIQNNQKLRDISNNKFEYLFIDEYQDINRTQESLIKLFHNENNKVMVVGDINQSIYGFRGADVRIFQNFNKSFNKFHNVKEYQLKINFRSTNNIIELSNKFLDIPDDKKIIGNYDETIDEVTEQGIKPKLLIYDNKEQEAKEIVGYIKKLYDDEKIVKYSDVSILFRSVKRDAKRFIDELDELGIKYEVIGDGGLFQKNYIKAILECFDCLAKEEDIKNEFLAVDIKSESILYHKLIKSKPLMVLFRLLESSKFIAKAIYDNDETILYNIGKLTEIISKHQQMFSGSDYVRFIDGLKKLNKSFLDTEQPVHSNINSIKLLTLHKSKGLEYPLVIIPGVTKDNYKLMNKDLVSDLFPDYDESEDSKRSFYVGITRAMQSLIVSYYKNKSDYVDIIQKSNLMYIERCGHGGGLNKFVCRDKDEESKVKTLKLKKEMICMTYYKLIEYWKCKYAYKLRFHYNLIVPFKGELGYGSKIHTILYYTNLILTEKNDLSWEEILKKIPKKNLNHFQKYENKIKIYLKKFKNELKSIVKPEMSFRFNIGNLIVDGRLDLLVKNDDDSYTIIEFKSGRYNNGILKKEKDMLNSAIEQIELYALAIKK
ncbi:ATP-dependent helicase, partial [archaeon]|nr:ATP-dependent helicase [archaeon]